MTRHQLVQWILLPGGITAGGQLSASVFVAPRLRPDAPATLADFPDFADWRSVLDGLVLEVQRADGTTEAPLRVAVSASGDLWRAVFPDSTTVRSFHFDDLADRAIVSYPVNEVLGHLRNRWAELALAARDDLPITSHHASPIGPTPTDEELRGRFILADHFAELRQVGRRGVFEGAQDAPELSDRFRAALDGAAAEARERRLRHLPGAAAEELLRPFGGAPGGTPADAFYALAGFHGRPSQEDPRPFPADRDQAKAELENALDFHHHLSILGDHPAMLRALGLVIDLEIRPDFVPVTSDADPATLLRLKVQRPSAFPARGADPNADTWNTDVTPWTACRLTEVDGQAVFSAVERTARLDFAHGFLRMDPARYAPVTVDVDGLALKALNTAETLQRQETQPQRPVEEPDRDGVPTIRTGGIALAHTDKAKELHEDFQQARKNNEALDSDPDNPPVLAAEDLLRGFRMDIFTGGHWRSLHQRHITYTPARDPAAMLEVDDEGSVQLSLTAEADRPGAPADPDRPVYAHEAMTTWDGWSLSVPRPGDAIPQEPAAPEAGTDVGSMQLSITTGLQPGTLPRLRFQSDYRTRLRTVDLAGNSHGLADADQLLQVLEGTGDNRYLSAAPPTPMTYRRFEPVPPPELVPRLPFGPGESQERLVIRSTPGQSAAQYAAASQAAADPMLRFTDFCDRHVAAAKASLQLVETHGLLDAAIDAVRDLDPAAAAAAAQPFYDIASRECGTFRDTPGAAFVQTGVHDDVPQGYVCLDADTVELPYLPDPLGEGALALITLEPGQPEQRLEIGFGDGGGWHNPLPLRLRLAEGGFSAAFSAPDRLLTITLPAGRAARLRLSSLFRSDPEIFGIIDWCRQELSPADADEVFEAVLAGTHWMTTPWRDLTLVHAVQRPVQDAELELELPAANGILVLARPGEETAAQLSGRFLFDLPSTAQLDLSASWQEIQDDPSISYASEDEMTRPARRDVFSLVVPEPFGTPWIPEITRFIEQLDERAVEFRTRGPEKEMPEDKRLELLKAAGVATTTQEKRRLEAGAAQLEKLRAHEFGDTRYRRVTYQPTAATRFREYFDPAMPVAAGNSPGAPLVVDVLSSALPAKPVVLQVLPIMTHDQFTDPAGAVTSTRRGVGLRVWLGRPWWSSGAGELLAVVCNRGGPMTASSDLSRDITLIAQDPAHGSVMPQPLTAASFPGAVLTRRDVGISGTRLTGDIAAFRPVWDPHRKAWFCDIEFSTGTAYFPFVRLGLARYQAMSIPGCELSPIVSTAFVQTVPDRALACSIGGDGAAALVVSGPAPSSSLGTAGVVLGTNVMEAVVEAQVPTITDPFLGWTAIGGAVPLDGVVNPDGTATWSGSVPATDGLGRRLRLAVREFELHPSDDRSMQPSGALVATRRLVHVDVVPL